MPFSESSVQIQNVWKLLIQQLQQMPLDVTLHKLSTLLINRVSSDNIRIPQSVHLKTIED